MYVLTVTGEKKKQLDYLVSINISKFKFVNYITIYQSRCTIVNVMVAYLTLVTSN